MKMLILADLHNMTLSDLEVVKKSEKDKFDVIVTLGNINAYFIQQIRKEFNQIIIGVLGNHDNYSDYKGELFNIHCKTANIDGIEFVGVEGSVRYKIDNGVAYLQQEIQELCKSMSKADIIVSHNSPYGIHDEQDISHQGFMGITEYIEIYKPKYCLHGHMHNNVRTHVGDTEVIGVYGVAILDYDSGELEYILEYKNKQSKYFY